MKKSNSPSQHIYKLYDEFEKRDKDTSLISQAVQHVTGTVGKSNLDVVSDWIEEMSNSRAYEPF